MSQCNYKVCMNIKKKFIKKEYLQMYIEWLKQCFEKFFLYSVIFAFVKYYVKIRFTLKRFVVSFI